MLHTDKNDTLMLQFGCQNCVWKHLNTDEATLTVNFTSLKCKTDREGS